MTSRGASIAEWRLLGGLLLLALAIRLWGIDYGLPFVYWTDEYHEVMRAMELGAGGFNLARAGKGGFYLLLFLEYGVYFVCLKLTGAIASTSEFATQFVNDPTMFYLLGRTTAALFGAATVGFVYLLARRAYQPGAGLLAATFLAVNVLHVDLSHRVGVDVPMAFFVTMALYFGVRIADGGGRRDYVFASVCAALATTTKLPGIVVVLPLVVAHCYNVARAGQPVLRLLASANVWTAITLFLVVWIATNPGILFAGNLLSVYADPAGELAEEVAEMGPRPNLWVFYLFVLKTSMGWPLLLASAAGSLYAFWKRSAADVMLLSFVVVTYVAIASTTSENLYFPRYALPIVVCLSILAARFAVDLIDRAYRWRNQIAVLAITLLVSAPLARSLKFSYSLTQTDTRTQAKEWFDEHVVSNSKVLIEGGKISASRLTVQLQDSRESLDRRIEYWSSREPRQAKYLQIRRSAHKGGGYDLELVRIGKTAPLDEYLLRGIEYFVVRPESFLGSRRSDDTSKALVRSLRSDPRIRMVAQFDATNCLRQGPPIEIYRFERVPSRGS